MTQSVPSIEDSPVYKSICSILADYVTTDREITPDTNIVADLEIDSVNVFDLIMEVEDAHEVSISMETISSTHTVGELTQVVEGLVRANHKD